jgi:hypothetical protein
MNALEMLDNLEAVDVQAIAIETVQENTDEIVKLNVEQLRQGYNSAGVLIGDYRPYKNADYAFEKNQQNPEPGLGNPDLIHEGDFTRAFFAKTNGLIYEIGSTDAKADDLEKKYKMGGGDTDDGSSGNIFGLDNDSKQELQDDYLRPAFQDKYTKATGLKFV